MFKFSSIIILVLISINLSAQDKKTFVTTDDGTRLYVKKSGSGPLCIFIHGGPGAWSKSFEELKGYNLEQKLTMIYYDQRGCGRSENSVNGNYSLERMIEDIDLIRKHYKSEKVYLLAHSFGGIFALNYALKFPDHVKGLILANSTLSISNSLKNQINYTNKLLGTNYSPSDTTFLAIMAAFKKARKALSEKKMSYKILSDNKKTIDLVNKIDQANPSSYDFSQKVFMIDDYLKDYTKVSNQVETPVLIIAGKKDHSIGENHYTLFNFKDQKVKKINGGHLLYYENNKEFSNSIFSFVNKTED